VVAQYGSPTIQEDLKFQASLDYTGRPCLQKKKKKKLKLKGTQMIINSNHFVAP
jgi:hypothetical protein